MDSFVLNSGLDSFVMMDKVTHVDDSGIIAAKHFNSSEPWMGIESLAQASAMWVRNRVDFQRHAFLLKVKDVTMDSCNTLNGPCRVECTLTAGSEEVFSFEGKLYDAASTMLLYGIIIIGTVDYSDTLKKDILEKHYRGLFVCLKNV